MRTLLIATVTALMALPLTACGGGNSVGSIPNPPPSPPPPPLPPPPPPPPPSGPLAAAVQTSSPASPVATNPGATFGNISSNTDFPLLIAGIDATFGGNSGITNDGAVLTARPGGDYSLTVNHPVQGFTNATVPGFPGTRINQPQLLDVATDLDSGSLDYTRWGWWMAHFISEGMYSGGAFAGGYLTPANAIPNSGSATYSGTATGLYNIMPVCNCVDYPAIFNGNVSLTANFGAATLGGSITGITLHSLYAGALGTFNDIGFSATIDRSNNFFSGTTSVLNNPGGQYSFGSSAAGDIRGRFYGPGASEIGAVFGLSDGNRRLIGSFGAKAN